jgi:hypothetical protein
MMLSAFGEHLLGSELEAAAAAAAGQLGRAVTELAAMPVFPEGEGERGRHLWVVELAPTGAGAEPPAIQPPPGFAASFAAGVDRDLQARNDDYRAHRSGGFGLAAPDVRLVPPGTFVAWMKKRGKLGGQHKVPRVVNDRALQDDLLAFCGLARR